MVVGFRRVTLQRGRKSGGQTGLTSKRDTKKLMPMKVTTRKYDTADHLRTPEEIAAYVETTFEDANGDAAFIAKALGNVARSKGMAKVARGIRAFERSFV